MSPPSSKNEALYGISKQHKLAGEKEISSSSSLYFTSQLRSLIDSSKEQTTKLKRKKDKTNDVFSAYKCNTAKRAKKDLKASAAVHQPRTADGQPLDQSTWQRSQQKMEEKARLYAALKRGDVEDTDDRYAVDFDRKWADNPGIGEDSGDQGESSDDGNATREIVEYTDEFGRTRTGTVTEAAQNDRIKNAQQDVQGDRFTARPSAPSNVIYGDTIQHEAFNPDATRAMQMEELARNRDKSDTPPPQKHFDADGEIRTRGTGFYKFSNDAQERQEQMHSLEQERIETEVKRKERITLQEERKRQLATRRALVSKQRGKRQAEDFLDSLGEELSGVRKNSAKDPTQTLEDTVVKEQGRQT